jgi:hypothetical protein
MRGLAYVAGASLCAVVLTGCGDSSKDGSPKAERSSSSSAEDSGSGCRFATLEEMSEASGEQLTSTEDRGEDGCVYEGDGSYVELTTFPASQYEANVNDQSDGDTSRLRPVDDLGIEAVYVSPDLFVKVDGDHAFKVLKAPQEGQEPEIAVAEIVAPRISG